MPLHDGGHYSCNSRETWALLRRPDNLQCRSCISGSDSAEGFGGLFLYIDSHAVDLSGMNSNPLTLIDERASRTVAISRLVE